MSIMSSIKSARPFKGFSAKILVSLLVVVGAGIFLMLGSLTGVGVFGAMNHIASTYHRQTVESSMSFVTRDIESLLDAAVKPLKEQWQQHNLEQKDVADKSRFGAAAWYWDRSKGLLHIVAGEKVEMINYGNGLLPFRQLVQPTADVCPAYPGSNLPKLPESPQWNIVRQVVDGKAAWIIWTLPVSDTESGIWGFRIMQESIRPQLIKLMRRLCHDNFMKIAILDEHKNMLMAVNYEGELKNTAKLVANEKQIFIEEPLGQVLDGLTMQIVYVPGIFGQFPDWGYKMVLAIITLLGSLLVGGIVYFYSLERVNTSKLELQNDWVLNLAHSLRGPCHSLGVLTDAMKANSSGDSDDLFALARREIESMDTHCRQFLQFARKEMKANNIRLEPVEIQPLVKQAIERVLLRFPLVGKEVIQVKGLSEIVINGNIDAASETLLTVLDNALKYSPGKPEVTISGEKTDSGFKLTIVDKGLGIAVEESSMIGTAFFRSSRQGLEGINGTGIGLYLAREACAAMGWQMNVHSEGVDKGTSISFVMPMANK